MKSNHKFINSLQFIDADKLNNITVMPGIGVFLNAWRNWQSLNLCGLAEMSVASTINKKSRIFTTKITANLAEHFSIDNRNLCFLATSVDGTRYLIGLKDSPYPTANTEDIMPSGVTQKSGCTLTVEYKSDMELLEVLD